MIPHLLTAHYPTLSLSLFASLLLIIWFLFSNFIIYNTRFSTTTTWYLHSLYKLFFFSCYMVRFSSGWLYVLTKKVSYVIIEACEMKTTTTKKSFQLWVHTSTIKVSSSDIGLIPSRHSVFCSVRYRKTQ